MDTRPPYFRRSVADYFDRLVQKRGQFPEYDSTRALRIVLGAREDDHLKTARREHQLHQRIIQQQAEKLEECRAANPLLFARRGDPVDLLFPYDAEDMLQVTYIGRADLIQRQSHSIPTTQPPAGAPKYVFKMTQKPTQKFEFETGDFLVLGVHQGTSEYNRRGLFREFGWPECGKEYAVVDSKNRNLPTNVSSVYSSFLVLHAGQTTNRCLARVGARFNPWCPFGLEMPEMPDGMGPYTDGVSENEDSDVNEPLSEDSGRDSGSDD